MPLWAIKPILFSRFSRDGMWIPPWIYQPQIHRSCNLRMSWRPVVRRRQTASLSHMTLKPIMVRLHRSHKLPVIRYPVAAHQTHRYHNLLLKWCPVVVHKRRRHHRTELSHAQRHLKSSHKRPKCLNHTHTIQGYQAERLVFPTAIRTFVIIFLSSLIRCYAIQKNVPSELYIFHFRSIKLYDMKALNYEGGINSMFTNKTVLVLIFGSFVVHFVQIAFTLYEIVRHVWMVISSGKFMFARGGHLNWWVYLHYPFIINKSTKYIRCKANRVQIGFVRVYSSSDISSLRIIGTNSWQMINFSPLLLSTMMAYCRSQSMHPIHNSYSADISLTFSNTLGWALDTHFIHTNFRW